MAVVFKAPTAWDNNKQGVGMYNPPRASSRSHLFTLLLSCVTLCCLSLLSGCNGGGGETTATNPGVSGETAATVPDALPTLQLNQITGVAAIGRPLDGYVYIQDAAGITVNVPIAADGTYQADVGGMQPPFIIRAQTGDGATWYSYAPSLVPANISQLTTLVMFIANGKADLADLFAAWPQRHATLTADAMLHAQAVVNLNFGELFEANGLDHTVYNFFTTLFTADGTGFDAVLDVIGSISFGVGGYEFNNPVYQAAFDETVEVTDPAMIASLGASSVWSTSQPPGGVGITISDPPVFDDFILTGGGSWTSVEPPFTGVVLICAETDPTGSTCPEGASCTVVDCGEGSFPPDGGGVDESGSSGTISTGDDSYDGWAEPLPPDYVDEPPQTDTEYLEDPGAMTSEETTATVSPIAE